MNPGNTTLPSQSTDCAAGYFRLNSAALPTSTMFSPSVTTDASHRTRLSGPRVTTIPFSNRVVMMDPFACHPELEFAQGCKLVRRANAHAHRAHKTLLGTDAAANAAGWIRVGLAQLIEVNCQVWATGAVAAADAQIELRFRDRFDRGKVHEVGDRVGLSNADELLHRPDA